MRTTFAILPAVLVIQIAIAGGGSKFPASEIPAELRKDVDVVVRDNTESFRITARDKATYHVYKAITILNDRGKSFATEVVSYDKLTKIKSFQGSVYDASGALIKRLKSGDIYDQSAVDGVSLYSDNRIKAANLSQGRYPYTVEYEYEIEFKYLFQIPTFRLLTDEKMSVQHASFTLEYPAALKPRYKLINIEQQPVTSPTSNGNIAMTWNFENVPSIKEEPFGPSAENIYPHILSAPSQFEYADYVGSMNTWDEFGKWIASLNKGRDQLPEATRQKIHEITDGLKTREEKVKALYHFLQSKTRYVGIQLGIGGFQPFEASVVDETGYGDCKALSNYMVSMLKEIGIKSYYALIYAGPNAPKMKTDFVCPQFNHAVVAVPNDADTLWLECTSQTKPFGYAGRFTGDRSALLITDDGAKIAHTPVYTASQNVQASTADVVLDLSGSARASVRTTYHGLQYENGGLNTVLNGQREEQKKWVLENTQIPSFDLLSFKMQETKDKLPVAVVELELAMNRFANVSGKRVFLTPNLLNRNTYVPEPVEARKTNVVRRFAYTDFDTVRYKLPEQLYPEFLPKDVSIRSRFGDYEATFKVENGALIYTRKVMMKKGEFPPESYAELIDFFRDISKADNIKMVFVSKT